MQIKAEADDAEDFISVVVGAVDDLLHDRPSSLILIKTDSWFGPNWLGFSGKALGLVGRWHKTLRIPPFVPSRIVSQRRFSAPLYNEVDAGKPIHLRIPARVALTRKVSEIAPQAALVWYGGNSRRTGRGCIMAHIPHVEAYCSWYAEWHRQDSWNLIGAHGSVPQILRQSALSNLEA